MNVEVVTAEKNDLEVKLDNLTVAEILRVYLNEGGVEFAAWRREHPFKPLTLKVKTSGETAKKAVSDAVSAIKKDLDKLNSVVKKK